MESFYYESLRWHPGAAIQVRKAVEDQEINIHVYGEEESYIPMPIKKGDLVFLNHWRAHRDEKTFDRPLEFVPERFELAAASKQNKIMETIRKHPVSKQKMNDIGHINAFESGYNVCLGRFLVRQEFDSMVMHLLRNYKLEKVNTVRQKYAFILKACSTIYVKLTPRNA